jgi:hypothetical protein
MKSLVSNGGKSNGRGRLRPSKIVRLSQLSAFRQLLVRLCQATNYGSIHRLEIRDSEPVFNPPPLVLVELKLDAEERARPEVELVDFNLSDEVVRLMDRLDELRNAMIECIEVRAGIPRRVIVECRLMEAHDDIG